MGKWTTKSISEIAELIMGQSPEGKYYNHEGDGMPFLQGCSEFGSIHPDTSIYTTDIKKISPKDSILFSVRAPVGKLNRANQEYCIGRGVAAINCSKVNNDFLFYALLLKSFKGGFTSQGSTFDSINYSELAKCEFDIPDEIDEQLAINQVLSSVDQAIDKTEQLIAKYERIMTGMMQDLLEDRVGKRNWKMVSLADICELNPSKPKLNPNILVSFFAMSDVSDSAKIVGRDERSVYQVSKGYTSFKEGDILVAKITPCFENGKGAYAIGLKNGYGFGSTEFHILRPNEGISGRLVYYITTDKKFRTSGKAAMTGSAGQQRVQAPFFNKYRFSFPDEPMEQERIADVLEEQDNLIQMEKRNLNKYYSLKSALMQDLLTGKVRVDPILKEPIESI